MIAYNLCYHQSDIYLSCHAILAVANKSIYGYILRNMDNHQLQSLDMLAKDSEVGKKKLKTEMKFGHRDGIGFVHTASTRRVFCLPQGNTN